MKTRLLKKLKRIANRKFYVVFYPESEYYSLWNIDGNCRLEVCKTNDEDKFIKKCKEIKREFIIDRIEKMREEMEVEKWLDEHEYIKKLAKI